MARRPEFPTKAMMPEHLKESKSSQSLLSLHIVRGNYEETLLKCRLRGETPPPPRLMQELATLGRVLWGWSSEYGKSRAIKGCFPHASPLW